MTQPGKDGVAQWGGAALPDLIEAMAGRSRQLWLRLVIGVLIACIVGPSLGAPLTVGWYVAWSLLQLAEVAWTRREAHAKPFWPSYGRDGVYHLNQ